VLIQKLRLVGPLLITPKLFRDERGFFFESYQRPLYEKHGISCSFIQTNISSSRQNTIRGLHFQIDPGQDKLVTCLRGKIWDVIVDIRPASPTFGQWEAVELNSDTLQQLFIPVGFAHGFCALSEEALVEYQVSTLYDPEKERAIRWDDPSLAIPWPTHHPILSPKDQKHPFFEEIAL
jgi:dTDP-4-dehydrorhamnose 3,5-epimerase